MAQMSYNHESTSCFVPFVKLNEVSLIRGKKSLAQYPGLKFFLLFLLRQASTCSYQGQILLQSFVCSCQIAIVHSFVSEHYHARQTLMVGRTYISNNRIFGSLLESMKKMTEDNCRIGYTKGQARSLKVLRIFNF